MDDSHSKFFKTIPAHMLKELIYEFIEVDLKLSFNIIRETLARIGDVEGDTLYQLSHILFKKNKYYIVHYKQLYKLDGQDINIETSDINKLYKIVSLLYKWGFIDIKNDRDLLNANKNESIYVNIAKMSNVKNGSIKLQKKYNL